MTIIHIATARVYKFGHVTFEWHDYLGPEILSGRTLEPIDMCQVGNRAWAMISKFQKLSKEDRELYRLA